MKRMLYLSAIMLCTLLTNCSHSQTKETKSKYPDPEIVSSYANFPVKYTDAQWRKQIDAGSIFHPA